MSSNRYLFSVLLSYVFVYDWTSNLKALTMPYSKTEECCTPNTSLRLFIFVACCCNPKRCQDGNSSAASSFSYLEPFPALDFTRCTLGAPLLLLSLF